MILLRPLDTVIKENSIDHVDFIKMDVDGYETKVIRGSMHTLEQHRPIMFFEVTTSILKAERNNFIDLPNTLDRLGYDVQTEARKPIKDLEAYLAKVPISFGIKLFATHADR